MAISSFNEESRLNDYYNHRITADAFIKEATSEIQHQYALFCEDNGLQEDNIEAAKDFIDWWYYDMEEDEPVIDIKEESATPGQENNDDSSAISSNLDSSIDLFNAWNKNIELISKLSNSNEAAEIICWRKANPMEQDQEKCSKETGISMEYVSKWWRAVDWLDGYIGGSHFHLVSWDKNSVKKILGEACLELMDCGD